MADYHRAMTIEPAQRRAEDVRSVKPYLFSRSPVRTFLRRSASIVVLVSIDIAGLVLGLYLALALRAFVFDPKPVLWGLL